MLSQIIAMRRSFGCAGRFLAFRCALLSTSTFAAVAFLAISPGAAQTVPQQGQAATDRGHLPQIKVSGQRPKLRGHTQKSGTQSAAPPAPNTEPAPPAGGAGAPPTPLNTNVVATSASRLGLTVRQTPATVEVVDQKTMQEQGYRTTTETAQGAVGVLSGDAAGAPAGFSMRGFTYGEVNALYNGIWIGPQDITSRVMDTANLEQVEFLKGPSSLMSGLDAIGGSVNYVTKQPTSGPIQNEADVSFDSLGTFRSHFGSGGSTAVQGLDYRVDMTGSKINSFIDGDYRDLTDFSMQLNYRASNALKAFLAVEYKKDSGHSYWGTPLVPASFAGSHAISGVVSGSAVNTFDGTILGPLTVDSRTLTTNYNVADNATGAQELWLRSGFEWAPLNNVTVKDQVYYYQAKRNWIDSETYAFDLATSTIDRDRFAVSHDQYVVGNNADLTWDSRIFGMDNRFAAQLQASRNWITFRQDDDGGYPDDTVAVVDPSPGVYGAIDFDTRHSRLDTIAGSFEDRLKLTSAFALIGGVRLEDLTLARNGINADGTIPPGEPFAKTWTPVSYRAAYTYEPIRDLTFYSMYATAFDPAVAAVFSVTPGTSLELTSSRIYETDVKQLFWDNRAEWTFSAYDIDRRNVYVQINDTTSAVAGEVATKGIEAAAAVRPIEGLKLWGNVALTQARYVDFDAPGGSWTGNTPSNVAPIIVNAGASYRFDHWRWPVEIGGSVRHVGNRYLYEDDATTMDAYTVADAYTFVDIPGKDFARPDINNVRITFRVRNLTNAVYAAWSDPGYPDQIYLGAPRTYELAASAKW
jgi:iron complex outermembrane receptor protein